MEHQKFLEDLEMPLLLRQDYFCKYLFILPPGKNYNVSYEASGYLFNSENL